VEFLFAKFPELDWESEVRDAAVVMKDSYNVLPMRVVRFYFKNGFDASASSMYLTIDISARLSLMK